MNERVPDFDLYRELEVREDASPETIDAAYRSLARRLHPDSGVGGGDARRMVRLNTAHEWLSNANRRTLYDRARRDQRGASHEPGSHDDDPDLIAVLMPEAVAVIDEYARASASLLQRRLGIDYVLAARLVDELEAQGYIGPFDGSHAREVLRRHAAAQDEEPEGPAALRAAGCLGVLALMALSIGSAAASALREGGR